MACNKASSLSLVIVQMVTSREFSNGGLEMRITVIVWSPALSPVCVYTSLVIIF